MSKWWMSAVVLAGWLGLAPCARAQYLPDSGPSAPPCDPVACPCGDAAVPGPMNGYLAPYGPGSDLALPANHSSAFPCEPRYEPEFCFFHGGTIALKRQRLGDGVTAFSDASTTSRLDNNRETLVSGFTPRLNLGDLDPRLAWGLTATVGYMFGDYSVELSGLWLPESTVNQTVQDQGRLNAFFYNAPIGFQGNNGLFRQADIIRHEFTNQLAGADFNVRYFSQVYANVELLMGVRYVDYMERLSIFVDDDGLSSLDIRGQPSPLRQATYTSRTRNRIFGPQIGAEYQTSLLQGVAVGGYAKATTGVNIADADQSLRRGDDLVNLNDTRHQYTFGCVFDLGVYVDIYMLERFRMRTGYQVMALTGILEAPDQVNHDLNVVGGTRDNSGSALFQGLTIQFQFLF